MEILVLSNKMWSFFNEHCTDELIKLVLSDRVTVSRNNKTDEFWDVSEIIDKSEVPILELMKVLYVYTQKGGVISYHGERIEYAQLCKKFNDNLFQKITQFWNNNETNDVCPIYDCGIIDVPKILPKYAVIQQMDGFWYIEKRFKGNYCIMEHEKFPTKDLAMQRANELNLAID